MHNFNSRNYYTLRYKISIYCYSVVYVTMGISMKTAPVRISIELKEQLENAMKQYRHKTGENITISELLIIRLHFPYFSIKYFDPTLIP